MPTRRREKQRRRGFLQILQEEPLPLCLLRNRHAQLREQGPVGGRSSSNSSASSEPHCFKLPWLMSTRTNRSVARRNNVTGNRAAAFGISSVSSVFMLLAAPQWGSPGNYNIRFLRSLVWGKQLRFIRVGEWLLIAPRQGKRQNALFQKPFPKCQALSNCILKSYSVDKLVSTRNGILAIKPSVFN